MSHPMPKVARWYQERDSRQLFEIVALDLDEATVQVQYLDGELADFDLETWAELDLIPAAAPEDWRAAFEVEDELDPDATLRPVSWGGPLAQIEPDTALGVDDF